MSENYPSSYPNSKMSEKLEDKVTDKVSKASKNPPPPNNTWRSNQDAQNKDLSSADREMMQVLKDLEKVTIEHRTWAIAQEKERARCGKHVKDFHQKYNAAVTTAMEKAAVSDLKEKQLKEQQKWENFDEEEGGFNENDYSDDEEGCFSSDEEQQPRHETTHTTRRATTRRATTVNFTVNMNVNNYGTPAVNPPPATTRRVANVTPPNNQAAASTPGSSRWGIKAFVALLALGVTGAGSWKCYEMCNPNVHAQEESKEDVQQENVPEKQELSYQKKDQDVPNQDMEDQYMEDQDMEEHKEHKEDV